MVVSRGLKKLRPITRTVVNPRDGSPGTFGWRMVASGMSLLASPGSWSFAYWKRASLKNALLKVDVSDVLYVSVVTFELPVCSSAFVMPPFSKFLPKNS